MFRWGKNFKAKVWWRWILHYKRWDSCISWFIHALLHLCLLNMMIVLHLSLFFLSYYLHEHRQILLLISPLLLKCSCYWNRRYCEYRHVGNILVPIHATCSWNFLSTFIHILAYASHIVIVDVLFMHGSLLEISWRKLLEYVIMNLFNILARHVRG